MPLETTVKNFFILYIVVETVVFYYEISRLGQVDTL